jgi:membrane protease YdiL (CAAX protease family)
MTRGAWAAVVLLVVIAGVAAFRVLGDVVTFGFSDDWSEALLKLSLWVAPCALLLRLWGAGGYRAVAAELGLTGPVARGYAFGCVASLPMVVTLPFGATLRPLDASVLVGAVLVGPFAEEVLFRGWLFRQLSRRAGWPPILAMPVSATAFGLAHLHNLNRYSFMPSEVSAVVSAAAAGALFAWLVWRWNSLWPAIGLHACMNLSWQIFGFPTFATNHTAIDPTSLAAAGRIGTIVLAVVLTWILSRNAKGGPVSPPFRRVPPTDSVDY